MNFRALVLMVSLALLAGGRVGAQQPMAVDLRSADKVLLKASYWPVKLRSAPAVLLVHGIGGQRTDWDTFARLLQRQGIASLAPDLRGHGESRRRQTEAGIVELAWDKFNDADFQEMILDLNAAYDWLVDQPEIDTQRIGLTGASVMANLAVQYRVVNEDLAGLVLISPGLNYKGMRIDDLIVRLGTTPCRLLVSRNDAYGYPSCQRLYALRQEAGTALGKDELVIYDGNAHSTDILRDVPGAADALATWWRTTLRAVPPGPVPADTPNAPAKKPPAKQPAAKKPVAVPPP